jgi:hypothetical protein
MYQDASVGCEQLHILTSYFQACRVSPRFKCVAASKVPQSSLFAHTRLPIVVFLRDIQEEYKTAMVANCYLAWREGMLSTIKRLVNMHMHSHEATDDGPQDVEGKCVSESGNPWPRHRRYRQANYSCFEQRSHQEIAKPVSRAASRGNSILGSDIETPH